MLALKVCTILHMKNKRAQTNFNHPPSEQTKERSVLKINYDINNFESIFETNGYGLKMPNKPFAASKLYRIEKRMSFLIEERPLRLAVLSPFN